MRPLASIVTGGFRKGIGSLGCPGAAESLHWTLFAMEAAMGVPNRTKDRPGTRTTKQKRDIAKKAKRRQARRKAK